MRSAISRQRPATSAHARRLVIAIGGLPGTGKSTIGTCSGARARAVRRVRSCCAATKSASDSAVCRRSNACRNRPTAKPRARPCSPRLPNWSATLPPVAARPSSPTPRSSIRVTAPWWQQPARAPACRSSASGSGTPAIARNTDCRTPTRRIHDATVAVLHAVRRGNPRGNRQGELRANSGQTCAATGSPWMPRDATSALAQARAAVRATG